MFDEIIKKIEDKQNKKLYNYTVHVDNTNYDKKYV